jgi:ribosomal protein S2
MLDPTSRILNVAVLNTSEDIQKVDLCVIENEEQLLALSWLLLHLFEELNESEESEED